MVQRFLCALQQRATGKMWRESAGQKQFQQLHMQTEKRRSKGGKRRQICYTCHTAY